MSQSDRRDVDNVSGPLIVPIALPSMAFFSRNTDGIVVSPKTDSVSTVWAWIAPVKPSSEPKINTYIMKISVAWRTSWTWFGIVIWFQFREMVFSLQSLWRETTKATCAHRHVSRPQRKTAFRHLFGLRTSQCSRSECQGDRVCSGQETKIALTQVAQTQLRPEYTFQATVDFAPMSMQNEVWHLSACSFLASITAPSAIMAADSHFV